DIGNHRIRRIDAKRGIVETVAGNGEKKPPVAGSAARDTPVLGPRALFITGDTLWCALREGNSLWQLPLADGKWKHVAGTGRKGFAGDGGPAAKAQFDGPKGVAVGKDDRVY